MFASLQAEVALFELDALVKMSHLTASGQRAGAAISAYDTQFHFCSAYAVFPPRLLRSKFLNLPSAMSDGP